MKARHDALAEEMLRRGGAHKSPYEMPDLSYLPTEDREGQVNIEESRRELWKRCAVCRARYERRNHE
jgi:hypothetical protein